MIDRTNWILTEDWTQFKQRLPLDAKMLFDRIDGLGSKTENPKDMLLEVVGDSDRHYQSRHFNSKRELTSREQGVAYSPFVSGFDDVGNSSSFEQDSSVEPGVLLLEG